MVAAASVVVVNTVCMAALICASIVIKQLLGMIRRYTTMMPQNLLFTLSLMHMRNLGDPLMVAPVTDCVLVGWMNFDATNRRGLGSAQSYPKV
jgi:hypothetical protein